MIYSIFHIPLYSPSRAWIRLGDEQSLSDTVGGDGLLIARGNATYYNNIPATKNRCHKSRLSNGFIDNSTNVSINVSDTHFCHTKSSRRICWCVCQLLVVAYNLNLKNSIKTSVSVCYSNIIHEIQKCQCWVKKKSTLDMFRYDLMHVDMF